MSPPKRAHGDELRSGVYVEAEHVVVAFKGRKAHATVRLHRRYAATLTAKLAMACASLDDVELESLLRGTLTTNGEPDT